MSRARNNLNVMSPAPGSHLPHGALIEVSGGPNYERLIATQNALNFALKDQALDTLFAGRPVPASAHQAFADQNVVTFEDQGGGRWVLKANPLVQAKAVSQWSAAAREHGAEGGNLAWAFATMLRDSVFCTQLRDRAAAKLDATVSVASPVPTLGQRVRQLFGVDRTPMGGAPKPLARPRYRQ